MFKQSTENYISLKTWTRSAATYVTALLSLHINNIIYNCLKVIFIVSSFWVLILLKRNAWSHQKFSLECKPNTWNWDIKLQPKRLWRRRSRPTCSIETSRVGWRLCVSVALLRVGRRTQSKRRLDPRRTSGCHAL